MTAPLPTPHSLAVRAVEELNAGADLSTVAKTVLVGILVTLAGEEVE